MDTTYSRALDILCIIQVIVQGNVVKNAIKCKVFAKKMDVTKL